MRTPLRTCISCRAVLPPEQLRRFVRDASDGVVHSGRHAPGRGAWVCRPCGPVTGLQRQFERAFRGRCTISSDE